MIKFLSKVLPGLDSTDINLPACSPVTCCGICGTDHHLAEVSYFRSLMEIWRGSEIWRQGEFIGKFPVGTPSILSKQEC